MQHPGVDAGWDAARGWAACAHLLLPGGKGESLLSSLFLPPAAPKLGKQLSDVLFIFKPDQPAKLL